VAAFGGGLHIFGFLIKGEFLVAMAIFETTPKLKSAGEALKNVGQFLHFEHGRVVVGSAGVLLPICIGKHFFPRKRQVAFFVINLTFKVVGELGKIENLGDQR